MTVPATSSGEDVAGVLPQPGYGLSDPGMEEALYDMESMRRFAGIELNDEAAPDETSIHNPQCLL